MLIAGHETVASALAWTWYLLATAPEVEAKLHDEVDRVAGGPAATADDLPKLPYTGMVFDEALRLYPPAWIITRKALADDEIGGYRIPAGTLVVTSPYVTQRDARFWDSPDAFDPERFSRNDPWAGLASPTTRSAAGRGCASATISRWWRRGWSSRRWRNATRCVVPAKHRGHGHTAARNTD